MSNPQLPTLVELLNVYYTVRNAGAWSSKARIKNLANFIEILNYLSENQLSTLEDLEAHISVHRDRTEAVNTSMKAMSVRKKELETLLHYAELHQNTKPVYDEWKGIKWKGKREKFEAEHEQDLKVFHMACRKLVKHRSPDGKIPIQAWRQELTEIQQKYRDRYEEYKPMRADLMKLLRIKNCVDSILR